MNWGQGLKRVSAVLWVLAAVFCIGYTGVAISTGEEHSAGFYALLFPLAIVVPWLAHKATCWVIQGFTAARVLVHKLISVSLGT